MKSGIYHLLIVEVEKRRRELHVGFDIDFEAEFIWKTFTLRRPAESLRLMLESCGMSDLGGRVALNLNELIGLECLGMVVGRQIIEFYETDAAKWNQDFLNRLLRGIPNYVM